MRKNWLDRRIGCVMIGMSLLAGAMPACFGADWFVGRDVRSTDALPKLRVHGSDAELSVRVDVAAIESTTRTLSFSLPDGRSYVAEQARYRRYDHDWTVWAGKLRLAAPDAGKDFNGDIFISRYQGMVSAIIHSVDGDYLIVPVAAVAQAPSHRLVRVGASALCPAYAQHQASAPAASALSFLPPAAGSAKSGHQAIDVMALYTRDFLASAAQEQEVRAFITTAVAAANQIFDNSDVDTEYRLVHMAPLPPSNLQLPLQPETQGNYASKAVGVALQWMTGEPAVLTSMRQAYGADMVSLFTPLVVDTDADVCGIANLPRLSGVPGQGGEVIDLVGGGTAPFNQRAYIALEAGCGQSDFTYAHEHGHNLSMNHDRLGSPRPYPIHDFGYGYVFEAGDKSPVATVMGCNRISRDVPAGVCNRVPHFSNPRVPYNGVPSGSDDPKEPADNAGVAQLRSAAYAGFRAATANATPTIGITAPTDGISVPAGALLTFTASASDPEDGGLSSSIQWRSDIEPMAVTGSSFFGSLLIAGPQVITASVVDSGGKRVEHSVRVNVQGGPPEIRVVQGTTPIADGGGYSFASTSVDQLPIARQFNICNDGSSGLRIDNPASLVSGAGFTQLDVVSVPVIAPGACTAFRVQFHAGNPGAYPGAITIRNNDANENPYDIALSGVATASSVQLIASYMPSLHAVRTEYASSSDNPPSFDYYFDANLGRFEERAAAPCHQGQNNSTYLKVRLGGAILAQGGIDACTFQASWDSAPLPCNGQMIATLNSGQESIINTDDYGQDLGTCEESQPLRPHTAFNQPAWFRVDFVNDGVHYPRRLNFRKRSESLRVEAEADTYVSQLLPTTNYGSTYPLQVRSVTTNDGKFAFARFKVSFGLPEVGSARLHWKVLSYPISHLNLHRVGTGTIWNESLITWNNWGNEIGLSQGVVATLINLPADRSARFNIDSVIPTGIGTTYYTFGAETQDTRAVRMLGSREAPGAGDRPQLHINVQR